MLLHLYYTILYTVPILDSTQDHRSNNKMSSLPAQPRPQSSMGLRLYDRLKYDLDHDPKVSQEVALGKRVGMYRLRGHLGAGNFAKVKLGLHLITHGKL